MVISESERRLQYIEQRLIEIENSLEIIPEPVHDPWIFDGEQEVKYKPGYTYRSWHHEDNRWYRRGRRYFNGNPIGDYEFAMPL